MKSSFVRQFLTAKGGNNQTDDCDLSWIRNASMPFFLVMHIIFGILGARNQLHPTNVISIPIKQIIVNSKTKYAFIALKLEGSKIIQLYSVRQNSSYGDYY